MENSFPLRRPPAALDAIASELHRAQALQAQMLKHVRAAAVVAPSIIPPERAVVRAAMADYSDACACAARFVQDHPSLLGPDGDWHLPTGEARALRTRGGMALWAERALKAALALGEHLDALVALAAGRT